MKVLKFLLIGALGLFVLMLILPFFIPKSNAPGAAEIRAAEKLISSNRQGIAHGNSEKAKALATVFSNVYKQARGLLIEEAESGAVSLTDGDFPTYCQLNDDSVVFLVQVPKLRNFADGAKTIIVEAGWALASETVIQHTDPAPSTLILGVRGLVSYEKIAIGKLENGEYVETEEVSYISNLRSYFAPAASSQEGQAGETKTERPSEASPLNQ